MRPTLFILLLSCLAAFAQPVNTVNTLADLQRRKPLTNSIEVVYVRSAATNQVFPEPLPFRYEQTNALATNRFRLLTGTGVGRWVHDWDGDVRAFGVSSVFSAFTTDTLTNSPDNRPAIQAAIDYMSEKGGGVVQLPAGRIRLGGALFMKPHVHLRGTVAPIGFTASRSTTAGKTDRIMGETYLETVTDSGIGQACLIFDGPTYYTNQFTQSFVNFDGDTVNYRSGGNSVENITFSSYQWGWGGTNGWPVAGIVIRDVDGVLVRNCAFANIAGHGIWALGARALVVEGCAVGNTLSPNMFVAYTSDTRTINNEFAGGRLVFYRANTHMVQNNGIWNPINSLVTATTTTNIVQYGVTRPMIVTHVHRSDASTDTMINDTSTFSADTGTMVVFRGSNAPSPFVINQPYFVINGTDGTNIKLATSPVNALTGIAVDITQTATNGSWTLTGYDEAVVVHQCEEVILQGNRMDQSFQDVVSIVGGVRNVVDGNTIWEVGANQQPQRLDRVTGDKQWVGVNIVDSSMSSVSDNLITGGYAFGSATDNLRGQFIGVSVSNSWGVAVSGNKFSHLKYGVYSDSNSSDVRVSANTTFGTVARLADSGETNGANSRLWDGVWVKGTNPIVSVAIPASKTNLTDFTLRLLVDPVNPTVTPSGDKYIPLFSLSSSTNYTSWGQATTNSIRGALINGNGTTNWSLLLDYVGSQTEWQRSTITDFAEMIDTAMPMELVIVRSNGVWDLMRNGVYAFGLNWANTGANPPNRSNAIHAVHLTLGTWPLNLWLDGWIYECGLHNRAYGYTQVRDGLHRIPGTNSVIQWDFRNDTGSVVKDKSGNNVDGYVSSLNGTTFHEFGPSAD